MMMFFMFAITNPVLPKAVQGGENLVGNLISAAIGIFLIFGFVMAFFHLLFGAYSWVTASGDKNALEGAQHRITQAVVGLIIMFAVWALMLLLSSVLGIKFPNFDLPSLGNPGSNSSPAGGTKSTTVWVCNPGVGCSIDSKGNGDYYSWSECNANCDRSKKITTYNCDWNSATCIEVDGSSGAYPDENTCYSRCH